jgi:hypothetical protein
VEFVFNFIPEHSAFQSLFNLPREVALVTIQTQAKSNIIVDTCGKGVGLLEHHADKPPNGNSVHRRMIDIFTPEADMPLKSKAAHEVIHAVQATEYRALATPGRSNESRNGIFLNGNIRVTDGLKIPVVKLLDVAVNDGVSRF